MILEKIGSEIWVSWQHIAPIVFRLTGNDNMHKRLKEFYFRLDPTTDCRVSCP